MIGPIAKSRPPLTGGEHVFLAEDLVDLSLGYALTCHHAQGSEAGYLTVAPPPSRRLDPSWLYTAIRPARQQVDVRIHPDAPSVAEIDLYQSSTRGCHGANSAINRRQKIRSFLSRCRYGGDLHRRKRWYNLFRCPCLSTPGNHQAGRYSVATRNLSHLRARRQRLLDNPCLVVLRPAPPPLSPPKTSTRIA
ncbi:hypothetical protein ACVIHH_002928 [Bradyrhizobium sp. USDA 4518]